ncbi:MAG: hypothetical protein AB7N24_05625 [Dehalococcoidia bacterium]
MIRQRLFVLPLLLVVGVFASSCLFGARSPLSNIEGATGKALDADSVQFEISTTLDGLNEADATNFQFEARGGVDRTADESFFAVDLMGSPLEMRRFGDITYTRVGSGGWFKFEDGAEDDFADLFMPFFDPYELLKDLGVDPADVKDEGPEDVRGEQAERFSLTIESRDIDEDVVESFVQFDRESHIDFWIGENGLPVRISLRSTGDSADFDANPGTEVTITVTIELFGYGEPLGIERPSDDEIEDFDFTGAFGGATGDPFEGAECYGDRLEECLAVNPEVDAMAQDPAACQGIDIRVCFVAVGYVRADVMQAIVDFHKQTADIDVVILPSVPIPPDKIDWDASQIQAADAFNLMEAAYPIEALDRSSFIAVTGIDMRSEDFGWLFGVRYSKGWFGHNHGTFSYFRMAEVPPYDGEPLTDELLHLRVAKYAARYTALLHLNYETGNDINYLNYSDMYGFSDLDSMGTKWPEGPAPCDGIRDVICVIPDGDYGDERFGEDVRIATDRIRAEYGVPIEFRAPQTFTYTPTKPDWGFEFAEYLQGFRQVTYNYGLQLIGVTDDPLGPGESVQGIVDRGWPDLNLSVVSGAGAGTPGTAAHQERIYRLLVRGLLQARFGMGLNDDPASLLYRGIATAADLDGKTIPPIPK